LKRIRNINRYVTYHTHRNYSRHKLSPVNIILLFVIWIHCYPTLNCNTCYLIQCVQRVCTCWNSHIYTCILHNICELHHSANHRSMVYSNTIEKKNFLYTQRRPEACIILQQCTRRFYYLPVYFHIEGAILFEKSDK
jgi:hypothetical protein